MIVLIVFCDGFKVIPIAKIDLQNMDSKNKRSYYSSRGDDSNSGTAL